MAGTVDGAGEIVTVALDNGEDNWKEACRQDSTFDDRTQQIAREPRNQ
jgi:hypothetical protein